MAIGLLAVGAAVPTVSAQDATYDNVTVNNQLTVSDTAILSALQVSGAATFNDSLTVGGVNVANAISTNASAISTNASDISANASAISTNASDISANASAISTNASDISALDGRVTANETEISTLDGRITAASAGWGISAEGGAEENVAPGGAVDFSGDGNIEVGRNGTDLTFGLADDVEVAGSLSVTGGPSITVDGIDAGGKAITNVAAGNLTATSSDVVIGSQIYDLFIEEGAGGVRYFRALSAQPDSQALGAESIAIGPNSVAEGVSSLAAGDGASITATGEGAIALGQGASAGGDPLGGAGAIAVGRDSVAGANSAVALGDAAEATAGNATAVGAGAAASGDGSIALGDADATGSNAFAAGTGAYAGSPGGIALGTGAGVGTDGSVAGDKTHHIAIGTEAGRNVVGNQTTAIGYSAGSDITGDHNVAVGSHAGQNLQGDFNVAIGHEANRDAGVVERATAVGGQTQAGRNGVSVGYGATSEDSGVALGAGTSADDLGVALGRNATAEGGSVALGSGSAARSTDAAGTGYLTGSDFTDGTVVSVGNTNPSGVRTTRRIVNVADGSQDYDAVNVGQLKGAQQSVANLVGGNVTLGANGSFEGYVVELQDSSGTSHQYATVAEAINAVSSGSINVLPGDAVIYNPDGTVTVAEGVVGTDAVNVEQLNRVVAENGVKYFSVNSSEPANRDNAEASGTDAIAIGPATSADGASSLAAGHLAHSAGDESVALGHRVEALGNDSTAIGSESDAYGDGGVAIGLLAKSQGENSIVMGTRAQADPKTTDATVDNAVVIGTDAEATADNGIAVGESALASEVRAVAQGFDAHATADDAMAFGSNSRASGTSAQASGTNASASGTNAQASGTNASASGLNAQASGTDSIGYATDGIAMGTGAVAGINDPFNQEPERNAAGIAIGKQSLADEQHALALGVEAQARAQSATAIGDGAEATAAAEDGLAVGSGARVTAQNASAFGQGAEAVAGEALAMGSAARAAAQGATAIGEGAQANHQGSVALGSGAVTAEAVGTSSMTVDKNTYDFAGISPVATVSVGTAGAERTLTNVAAGRVSATSTDAINGSQLYGTNQAVNALADNLDTAGDSVAGVLGGNAAYDPDTHQVTMSNVGGTGQGTVDEAIEYAAQGWDISAQGGAEENVAPGGSVDFSNNDGNINIARSGTDLAFNLEDEIGVSTSVSVGSDTVIDGDSVTTNNLTVGGDTFVVAGDTVTYDGNEIATQADGLSFAGNTGGAIDKTLGDTTPLTVSGELAAGDASSGANLRVDSDGNQLNLVMARNLTELDSVTTGDSRLDTDGLTVDDGAGNITEVGADGLTIAGGPSVTTSGIDAGDLKITGVADGAINSTSSDAVNGSQLFGVADSVGDVIGGNAVVNADGSVTTSDIGNTGQDNVHDAIDVVNTAANAGWNATDAAGSAANIGPNGEVRFEGDSNISVAQTGADDAGVIAVALNENIDLGETGSVTTGDSVLDTDGLTVDDGTGNRTDLGAGSLNVAGAGNTIAIDGGVGDITGLTNTGLDGADFAQVGRAATEEQLDLVNQTANAGWNLTGSGVDEVNIGPDGAVDFQGDGNISVAQNGMDDDGQIDITLNPDLNVDSVTAGNSVLDTDGLTVDDGAGNVTAVTASGTSVTNGTDSTEYGADGMTIAGGPSVTTSGIDAGDLKITGVADGAINSTSSDAVNGSQLQTAGDSLASNVLGGNASYTGNDFTMSDVGGTGESTIDDAIRSANTAANAGWDISAQGNNPTNVGPGDGVDLNNSDGNIVVSKNATDNDVTFDLAANLTADSLTTGDSRLDTDGLTVDDGAGNVTAVTASGTSVTNGTDSTEYGADGMTIAGGPSVTTSGIDAGDLKITGVADGAINSTSSDAVNGSQLQAAGDSLASNVLGGNASYTGNDFTMSDVGGTGENTIDDAIRSANTAANAGWDISAQGNNPTNVGPGDSVDLNNSDGNIVVSKNATDNDVTFDLAANLTADSLTTGDSRLDTDGLTVDDGAGNVTAVTASGTSVTNGTNSTEYGADGMTIAGGPSVTTSGIDAGDLKITGVADGAINSTSSDAINGSQLQAAGDSLASNVLGGNASYTGNDFTMSDVGGTGENTIDDAIRSANTAANAGWNVADANGNSHNIGPNGKVTFEGDSNVTVTESGVDDDAKVQVALNDDITLDSVTTGNSRLDTDGLTVDDGAGNVTAVTASGTSVTDGTDSTEYGADGMTIAGGPSVTTSGIDAGDLKITGVADGAINSTSSDAINGSQLQAAGDSLASNVLGGNASYTGNDFTMSDVGGTGESTIDDAIRSANTAANAGWDISAQGNNPTNVGPGDSVDLNNSDGNIVVSKNATDNNVTFDLAANLTADSLTTGDSRLDTDGLTVDDGTNKAEYGADGMTIAGGPSVTTSGIDAGDLKITGVADGAINSTSSDAINGSQLQAAGDSLASNVLGGNASYTGNDFTMSDVGGTGENTIDDAIRSANTAANAGWDISAQGNNPTNVGPGDSVDLNNSDGNIVVSKNATDNDVTFDLAANLTADSLTTGDSRLDTDGLTVDDGAGNVTAVTASGTSVTNGTNSTEYGADGMTIAGGPSVTTGGINAGNQVVSNVANGMADTDAVNVSQLTGLADTPLTFAGDSGTNVDRKLGETLNLVGGETDTTALVDGNIGVVADGNDTLSIQLAENIDLGDSGSVTTGDSVLDTAGLVVNDNTANPTATTTVEAGTITLAANPVTGPANQIVIDANSGTIGGLTNTTFDPNSFTSGQAATEDQLGQVYTVANAGWHVSVDGEGVMADGSNNVGPDGVVDFTSDDNIVIDRTGTDLAFGLADSITLGDGDSAITVDGENGLVSVGDTIVNGAGVTVGDDVSLDDGGLTIDGGPSVTVGGIDAGGQVVTNVAAGEVSSTSTDAINGSQLYEVQQVANAGWNLSGSGAGAVNIGPNGAVDFRGDSNITVSQTGVDQDGVIEVALNDAITLGAGDTAVTVDGENGLVSVGDTVMDGDGVSIGDSVSLDGSGLVIAGGPSVTIGGIDAGGLQVTNVASGLGGQTLDQISGGDLMNAVNVGDLQQVAGEIGQDVAAAKTEVEAGSNITVSQTTGDDGQTIYTVETERDVDFDSINVGSVNIDKDNVDENGNTIIAGVGRGEISADSTDAVNGSQLHEVQEELGDINGALDGGMNFAADEGDDVNRTLGDTVAITGDDNITTQTTGDGVQVTLNNELNVDSVTTGKTTVSDAGVTIAGGPSMTADGIDGGGKRITNVAAGVDATDAVNVGQMQELNQRFAQEIHNVHGRISDVERNANAGTASALAASTVPQAWLPGKSMVGVGAGTYEGESAISVGVSRLSDNGRWVIQGKVTGDSQSNFGAGIGAGWHW